MASLASKRLFSCRENGELGEKDVLREFGPLARMPVWQRFFGEGAAGVRHFQYLKVTERGSWNQNIAHLQGLAVLRCETGEYIQRGPLAVPGFHSYLLCYTMDGEGRLAYEGKEYPLRQGDVFLIDALRPHRGWACGQGHWRFAALHIAGAPVAEIYRRAEAMHCVTARARQAGPFEYCLESIFDLCIQPDEINLLRCSSLVTELMAEFYAEASCRSRNLPDVGEIFCIRDYLTAHSAEKITLEELSHQFGISKYHLVRRFKAATGYTPIDFLLNKRLEQARDLLRYSSFNMEEICRLTGVSDAKQLNYLFHAHFGLSPSEYRRAILEALPQPDEAKSGMHESTGK